MADTLCTRCSAKVDQPTSAMVQLCSKCQRDPNSVTWLRKHEREHPEMYDRFGPRTHGVTKDLDEDREVLMRSSSRSVGDVRHLELVARKIAAGWQEGFAVDSVAASLPEVGTVTWSDLSALVVNRPTARGAVPERYVREVFEAAWLGDNDRYVDNPASDFKGRCASCGGRGPHEGPGHKFMSTVGMKLYMVGQDLEGDRYAVEVYDEQEYADHVAELVEEMQLDRQGTYRTWYVWDTDVGRARLERHGIFGERTFRFPLVEAHENPSGTGYWLVLRVNQDNADTYAVPVSGLAPSQDDLYVAIREAIDLAIPDDGTELEYTTIETPDGGAARLLHGRRVNNRWWRVPPHLRPAEVNPSTFREWPANYNAGRRMRGAETWHMVKVARGFANTRKSLCGKVMREIVEPSTIAGAIRDGINVCDRCAGIFGQRT